MVSEDPQDEGNRREHILQLLVARSRDLKLWALSDGSKVAWLISDLGSSVLGDLTLVLAMLSATAASYGLCGRMAHCLGLGM